MAGAHEPAGAHKVQSSNLETFSIAGNSPLSHLDIFAGNVQVDLAKKKIHLSFDFSPECPPNAFCAQGHQTITLPLVQNYTNVCNIKVYKALKDMMPADGVRKEILVHDNSNNTCPTFAALFETQVDYSNTWYNRIEGRLETSLDRFTGNKFEDLFFPFN